MEERYQICITTRAREDIEDIYNYIQKDSIYYATKTKNEISKKIENLSYMPFIGRKVFGFNDSYIFNQREIIYKSYKIIYEINSKTIYINRVLHSSRLLFPNLIKI